jgi:hypothetical protein
MLPKLDNIWELALQKWKMFRHHWTQVSQSVGNIYTLNDFIAYRR